jgi:mannosyltransferase OCH1-like enzyme
MNYGGIYLDDDVFVVKSLDKYRKFEMTVSWDEPDRGIGVQTLIAHKNARLLKAHFDRFR